MLFIITINLEFDAIQILPLLQRITTLNFTRHDLHVKQVKFISHFTFQDKKSFLLNDNYLRRLHPYCSSWVMTSHFLPFITCVCQVFTLFKAEQVHVSQQICHITVTSTCALEWTLTHTILVHQNVRSYNIDNCYKLH